MFEVLTSNYASEVLKLIAASQTSLDVLSYVVNFNLYKRSDKANLIFCALKSFAGAGGSVRFILDFPKLYKPNYHCNKFSSRRFKEAGFAVRFLHSGSTQHAKLILSDSSISIFGSHNLTSRSVLNRYDVSLLSDNIKLSDFFSSYYSELWQSSVEL